MSTRALRAAAELLAALATEHVGTSSSSPSPPTPAPAPAPVPITSVGQLLPPSTIAALARLEQDQGVATAAAEAEAERALDAFEAVAFGARPAAYDAPAGSALTVPAPDHLAWLRAEPSQADIREGYGDQGFNHH